MKSKSILIAATISVLLTLPACHPATIGIEEQQENIAVTNSNPLEIDWQGNMAENKKVLLENLPMIAFSDGNLDYLLTSLKRQNIGIIVEIKAMPSPAKPGFYQEGERVDVIIKDDLGNTFETQIRQNGYCYEIRKTDKDGQVITDILIDDIIDPSSVN